MDDMLERAGGMALAEETRFLCISFCIAEGIPARKYKHKGTRYERDT
jgi:hypothetical protein